MEEGGCECHVHRRVVPFQRGMRELAFSLYFHLKCSSFRARTRPNLHSALQFSSLTPCDSSPLHDSPRATSLIIRSSHLRFLKTGVEGGAVDRRASRTAHD